MARSFHIKLSIILFFAFIANHRAEAGLEDFTPAKLWGRIKLEAAKRESGFKVGLVNASILDGVSTSLQYRLQSEPSYVDGFYTRFDKYSLNFNLEPGDFIEALDTPVGIRLDKGSEIIFARQFKNQKESLTARPYSLKNLPFTAENAIERLVPGDFVAFQGQMALVVSVSSSTIRKIFDAGISTHALISGEFMVHLFRMSNNKIRVKLTAVRTERVNGDIGIKLSKSFEIFGIKFIDTTVERLVGLEPIVIDSSRSLNDVIMLDYVFDLNNPDAAKAYESLMLNKVQLKEVRIINPTASRTDLTNELLTDLTDIEDIALEDSNLPPVERRIDRVFKGSSGGFNKETNIKFGLGIWKFASGNSYGENKVVSFDKQDIQQTFLIDTLSQYKTTKVFFDIRGEQHLYTSNLLFLSDANWKPVRFVTLTSSSEKKIKDVTAQDLREFKGLVRDTIGNSLYQKINWSAWEHTNRPIINGYFKQEVFFNKDALVELPQLSAKQIEARFKSYLAMKGKPKSYPSEGGLSPKELLLPWIFSIQEDIKKIGVQLTIVVDRNKSVQQKFLAFEALQQIPIWKARGIGFLISFLPPEKLTELLRYELVLSAKNLPAIQYSFGTFYEDRLYQALMYIQNIIHNRGFDFREYANFVGGIQLNGAPIPPIPYP